MMTEIYAMSAKSKLESSCISTLKNSTASSATNKKRAAEKIIEKKKLEKKRALKRL